jgi:uncharacterized damage-inducible protein DinB
VVLIDNMSDLDKLRYPVGKFQLPTAPIGREGRETHLKTIEDTPSRLRSLVADLSDAQLETTYRPGGWTIRQVIHHVPDSHLNAYVRMKLAATEDCPTIRTYEEQLWAELPDAKRGPVKMSLDLLDALHVRWHLFMRGLTDEQFLRTFNHKDWGRVTIEQTLTLYSWHCRHHTAHVEQALAVKQ